MGISPDLLAHRHGHLPVSQALDELLAALNRGHAVLSAPTGSGKTTLTPLALLASPRFVATGIVMLEPRRIAARAAATRMSQMLGEEVGGTVGYRTRLHSRVSAATRIEVVTEGILIRKLQQDPELAGIDLVIFDEFHERSLQADLGLALCLDLAELRDDLRLLVMSATLETEPVSRLLDDAPVITASGRSYPVDIRYLPEIGASSSIADQVARGVLQAWHHDSGDILAFLPGAAEIRRCLRLVTTELPEALVLPLYGDLSHQEQDRVFRASEGQRRVILATPIAETSLTIDGIGCVVDGGWHRRPIYDPTSGLTRLVTQRISRASADQRAGRAGRTGPGSCYRLWNAEVDHSLPARTPPEILHGDLTPLALELALWGVTDPHQLRWLDPPRESGWESAVNLLRQLQLLDRRAAITPLGRRIATLPLHPRLGLILVEAERRGCPRTGCLLAALLSERDPVKGEIQSADIEERLRMLATDGKDLDSSYPNADGKLCKRLAQQAGQWQRLLACPPEQRLAFTEIGDLLVAGFPDRIALQRPGAPHRYQMAGGRGAELAPADPLAASRLLVAPRVDSRQGDGRIFLAAPLDQGDLQKQHGNLLREVQCITWDDNTGRVQASQDLMLDRLVLRSRPITDPNPEKMSEALLHGVRQRGTKALPWTRQSRELQARIEFLAGRHPNEWPALSDEALLADLDWLAPYVLGMRGLDHLRQLDLKTILLSRLSWPQQLQLDRLAPTHLQVPSGSKIRLDYSPGQPPVLAVRLQELFGLTDTPHVCNGEVAVLLHLLSPAGRPMQVTTDLASFWSTTYPQIRKELAGRYVKHYWPEDPFTASPTATTKKRMGL